MLAESYNHGGQHDASDITMAAQSEGQSGQNPLWNIEHGGQHDASESPRRPDTVEKDMLEQEARTGRIMVDG